MFSIEFKNKVKSKVNLLEIVAEYCKDIQQINSSTWIAHCPHPDHHDTTPSFRLWYKNNEWSWACMACHTGKKELSGKYKNYGTDCFAFLQWMSDHKNSKHLINFPESVRILARKYNIPIEGKDNFSYNKLREMKFLTSSYKHNLTASIKQYLHNRGLEDIDIVKWKIGAMTTRYGYRIMFPLIDNSDIIRGFSARLINWDKSSKFPKYWNSRESPIFHKSSYLYGIHLLDKNCDEIRITEGVLDVILGNKYNAHNVVGTLGTAFTQNHVELIKRIGKTPVFCLDGDKAGQHGIYSAIKLLAKENIYAKVCVLPPDLDLADLANKEKYNLEKYIQKHSVLYWQYLLKDSVSFYNSKIDEVRFKILPDVLEAYKSVQTQSERILFNNFVKERLGITDICCYLENHSK